MLRQALVLVLIVIGAYGLVRAWPVLSGPSLALSSPTVDASYPSAVVSVSGIAKRAARLTVNGAPVLHFEDGSFDKAFTFPSGGSILTVEATDRFGRTVTATRTIYIPE